MKRLVRVSEIVSEEAMGVCEIVNEEVSEG